MSDWSSDVCSSDLPNEVNDIQANSAPPAASARQAARPVFPRAIRRAVSWRLDRSRGTFLLGHVPLRAGVESLRQSLRVTEPRSDEHTSELQTLMRISYAVICLKIKQKTTIN